MRNQFKALCFALLAQISYVGKASGSIESPSQPAVCRGFFGTTSVFVAYGGLICFPENDDVLAVMQTALLNSGWPPPTAVYISSGLWAMWPVPFEAWDEWSTYECWRDFERSLSKALDIFSTYVPTIAVATPHAVCNKSFRDTFLWVALHEDEAARSCSKWLRNVINTSSKKDTFSACQQGLRSEKASAHLSKRVQHVVAQGKARTRHSNILLVDAFNLTSGRCEILLANDNCHYHLLLYDELQILVSSLLRDDALIP
mmetsp:Transcript_167786/g.322157  ORF Transcript_167786/g.322157 Transcript_167786/m.322157 type:complete len:258 (+) Transcript_167786:591-1364(+)